MKNFHKKYSLYCKAISPIHIGSGEILSRWEYIIFNEQVFYTTDEFWELLYKNSNNNIIDTLMNQIGKSESLSLTDIFKTLPNQQELKKTLIPSKLEFRPLYNKSNKPLIRNIHRFAGSPNFYFPGSSIKGSLRGSYEIQKISNSKFQNIAKNEKDEKILSNLYDEIKEEFHNFENINSPESKIFQTIRISDTKIPEESISVIPISFAKNEEDQDAAELYECIKKDTEFTINLTYTGKDDFVTSNLLPEVQKHQIVNFAKLYKNREKNDLTNFYVDLKNSFGNEWAKKRLIKCGYGTGQLSNSILNTWQNYQLDDTRFWRGKARSLLLEGKMKPGDVYPSAPKKHISLEDNEPLGWIEITRITAKE
jgi:CRISPR type III-A-associated RAMP protein Csm5